MNPEMSGSELDPQEQMTFDADLADLRASGIPLLEMRTKFGLDPAGMMSVRDTKPLTHHIVEAEGGDLKKTWQLITELHTKGPWGHAEQLKAAADPETRTYLALAAATQEIAWPGYTPKQYMEDRQRTVEKLSSYTPDQFDAWRQELVDKVNIIWVAADGKVPVAEGDPAVVLSAQGYKGCVVAAEADRFAQTEQISDALLEAQGLAPGFGEVRGADGAFQRVALADAPPGARTVWVRKDEAQKPWADMEPAAKRIGPGNVLTYKNEDLAVDLVVAAIENK